MALLTIDQLQTDLGRDSRPLTDDEIGTAQFFIDLITAYIESRCVGLSFTEVTDFEWKAQADYHGILELPYYPVTDVTSVKNAKSGVETCWDWDEFDTIYDLDPFETVVVTLDYGFDTPPNDLAIVARAVARRMMNNPENIRQQTVGAISETYASVGDQLTAFEDGILGKYEPYATSLRLGPQTGRNLRKLPTL